MHATPACSVLLLLLLALCVHATSQGKPVAVATPLTVQVGLGAKVTLQCLMAASPAPDAKGYRWQFRGLEVPGQTEQQLQVTLYNEAYYGYYRCTGSNAQGTSLPYVIRVVQSNVAPELVTLTGPTEPLLLTSPFNLTCIGDGLPAPQYLWYMEDSLVHIGRNSTLSLNASKEYDTVFTCVARNEIGQASAKVKVNVYWKPVPARTFRELPLELGGHVTLDCDVSGNPQPGDGDFQWSVGGSELAGETGRKLHAHLTRREDFANYSCNASNAVGTSDPIVFHLVRWFYGPEQMRVDGPSQPVLENSVFNLSCQADGHPAPDITWSRRGSEAVVAWEGDVQIVATRHDNTEFTCLAKNSHGNASTALNVTVHYKPVLAALPPPITAEIGDNVSLECNMDANPPPGPDDYVWLLLDSVANHTRRTFVVNVFNASFFTDVICTARNAIGESDPISRTIFPKDSSAPPVLWEAPSAVSVTGPSEAVREGLHFTLTCEADGLPVPSLTWSSDNITPLQVSGTRLHRKASWREDANFTCQAENFMGKAQASIRVEVYYVPFPVERALKFYLKAGGEVTLECQLRGNPPPEANGYKWYLDFQRLPKKSTQSLRIRNATSKDFGKYACTGTNSMGTSDPVIFLLLEVGDGSKLTTAQANYSTPVPPDNFADLNMGYLRPEGQYAGAAGYTSLLLVLFVIASIFAAVAVTVGVVAFRYGQARDSDQMGLQGLPVEMATLVESNRRRSRKDRSLGGQSAGVPREVQSSSTTVVAADITGEAPRKVSRMTRADSEGHRSLTGRESRRVTSEGGLLGVYGPRGLGRQDSLVRSRSESAVFSSARNSVAESLGSEYRLRIRGSIFSDHAGWERWGEKYLRR